MSEHLVRIAKASLLHNVVTLKSGRYLRAGGHQFQALWTRDFCFASRGLLAIGETDVVRDHLELLLANVRSSDGVLPKYFDSMGIWTRYFKMRLGLDVTLRDPLIAGYTAGIPPSLSIDSNALVIIAASEYVKKTGDQAWWSAKLPELKSLLTYYDSFLREGLVHQAPFADWQDSVRREGHTFLTNLLYWVASKRLGVSDEILSALRARIREVFFDPATGVYRSLAGRPEVSLDGCLLAIDYGFDSEIYPKLKLHPIWGEGFPGFATYPDYPAAEVSLVVRAVGARHYHDSIRWSWLMGLSIKVAKIAGDHESAARITAAFEKMAVRDASIYEIYSSSDPWKPFKAHLYGSEWPFSWGAGVTLDALLS